MSNKKGIWSVIQYFYIINNLADKNFKSFVLSNDYLKVIEELISVFNLSEKECIQLQKESNEFNIEMTEFINNYFKK